VVLILNKFLLILHGYSGHEESYNPSVEYIPTQEEIDSYQLMYEEDRPKFIPKRYHVYHSSFSFSIDLYGQDFDF
jgi:hypothetical protein